jgi:hypothetical protein
MSQYKNVITKANSIINRAEIKGFGCQFVDNPVNSFDDGIRQAKIGEFIITRILDRSNEDNAPFSTPLDINGTKVKIGAIVSIMLTKDIVNSVPTEQIIYGQIIKASPPITSKPTSVNNVVQSGLVGPANTKIGVPQYLIIGFVIIVVGFGILKWKKIIK